MNRQRIDEIGYMRGIAMLAVVLVHVTAVAFRMVEPTSQTYSFYMFMNRFFRFGTPTFIFITGFVMFYGYYYKQVNGAFLRKYFRNRMLFIFVPYLVWVILYEVHLYHNSGPFQLTLDYLSNLLVLIFQGNTFYHFYFFFVLIQLYLLFPLLLYATQKMKWFRWSLPFLGLVVQVVVYVTNYHYSWLPASTSYFMSFFFYFCLGGMIGIYFERIMASFKKSVAVILIIIMLVVGSIYVYMYHLMRWGLNNFGPLNFEYMYFMFASLSAITLLMGTHYFVKKGPSWLRKQLNALGAYSFGIFLIHPMVINYLDNFLIWDGSRLFHIGIGLRFVLTLVICYLIVYLFKRFVPLSNYIVGR
ncbi:acyltransferase [Alkalibacillus aidingensis]|uniref:acyltransferase n=1 Tax=Alkalibacillus aidingensis TaxID=2747607 RepID=UPI001660B666|nr:acyltransferase [Alkalibacillus aidingensis]